MCSASQRLAEQIVVILEVAVAQGIHVMTKSIIKIVESFSKGGASVPRVISSRAEASVIDEKKSPYHNGGIIRKPFNTTEERNDNRVKQRSQSENL